LVASAAIGAWLTWRSLRWPLIHDAPLMHYIAWLIGQGATPYRDAFDMNMPGVYLIHWMVLLVGGPGDLAWRLFDLGWLAAVCALLFAYCRPVGDAWTAAVAPTLFALYHVSGGPWRVGQRDFLLCLFLMAGALGVARSLERGGAQVPLLWAGAALGAGMTIKPHAALYWLGAAAMSAWFARRDGRSAVAATASLLAAGLAVPTLVLVWLGHRGGLGAFAAIVGGYLIPLYSRLERVSPWQAVRWYPYGWQSWALALCLGAVALLTPGNGAGARRPLALLGVGYGGLHFQLQGKGWEYQLYPLALFVCALAPFAVVRRVADSARLPLLSLRRPVALALWAALIFVLGVKGAEATDPPWIADKARRVDALTRDLRPYARPGATVQVMDVAEGGVHALLRLGVRQPTRFIYDFHFFHDTADPRIQALRAEFLEELESGRPAAIVVLRDTWRVAGYDRLAEVPGLTAFLDEKYALAVEGDGYRIYARRARP
jgi:hypothetical protein